MKICVNCGYANTDDTRFCTQCGRNLTSEGMFCPKCGSSIAAGSKFCDRCGSRILMTEGVVPLVARDTSARSLATNEALLAEAQSRLKVNMERDLNEAESRLGELSKSRQRNSEIRDRMTFHIWRTILAGEFDHFR